MIFYWSILFILNDTLSFRLKSFILIESIYLTIPLYFYPRAQLEASSLIQYASWFKSCLVNYHAPCRYRTKTTREERNCCCCCIYYSNIIPILLLLLLLLLLFPLFLLLLLIFRVQVSAAAADDDGMMAIVGIPLLLFLVNMVWLDWQLCVLQFCRP